MTKAKKHLTDPFSHAGINIFVDVDGMFTTARNGEVVKRPSLAAMKKYIDGRTPFVPFNALDIDGKPIKVIGIRDGRKGRFGNDPKRYWITSNNSWAFSIYVDSPANRKAVAAYNAHDMKTDKLMDKCNRKSSMLLAKIKTITPDEKDKA